jgi:hypothetical protein
VIYLSGDYHEKASKRDGLRNGDKSQWEEITESDAGSIYAREKWREDAVLYLTVL